MNEATTYVPGPTGSPLVVSGKVVGHISFCGDELQLPVRGKLVLFEMHRYFGPNPVNRRTGEILTRIPGGFWDAFERWTLGGKLVDGNVCVVPEWCPKCKGSGRTIRMVSKRGGIDEGPCVVCDGMKIISESETP